MQITIINGDMSEGNSKFSEYIENLETEFRKNNVIVNVFKINDIKVNTCVGCFICWWKTPGICVQKDDTAEILKVYMKSDFAIFASPISVGFISSALKKTLDRFLALLHPYIDVRDGELHHSSRYEKYPNFGFLIEEEKDTDDEDIEIMQNIFDRIAINFMSEKPYLKSINKHTVKELVKETLKL